MRKLKVKDIAPAVRLKKVMDCGEDIKKIASANMDANEAGIAIIGLLLDKYSESETIQNKVAEFLAGPFEMSASDVLDMDIDDFMNAIKEIGGISALASFFGNAHA